MGIIPPSSQANKAEIVDGLPSRGGCSAREQRPAPVKRSLILSIDKERSNLKSSTSEQVICEVAGLLCNQRAQVIMTWRVLRTLESKIFLREESDFLCWLTWYG